MVIDINRTTGFNESISWVNSRQRMCIRGLGGGGLGVAGLSRRV